MSIMQRLTGMVGHWRERVAPGPYTTFIDQESERLVELVFSNACMAVETAGRAKFHRPRESDIIVALIDKLQDAGF